MTDEDKRWFTEQLGQSEGRIMARVDEQFRQVDGRFRQVDERFRQVDEFFKQSEARIMARVDEQFRQSEARIMARVEGRMDAAEDRMKDFIRHADEDLETKIAAAFWKWARSSDVRTRQAISDSGFLSERLLSIEDRLSSLEQRKGDGA